ncbi:MAG TPA: hypothetical protein VE081_01040 [Sporichthyaceae bacterium]|nr:hypothetical protein [Sporichthyaceae bacterium]
MVDSRIAAATSTMASPMEVSGAAFMLHPDTFEASGAAGYGHPFEGYFAGRAGVMGDVSTDVVAAAFYSFPREVVQLFWEPGKAVKGPAGGAAQYQKQIAEWGSKHLAGVQGLDRYAELGEKIIAATPCAGLPVYAGWAAQPRVSDPAGHAMQVLMVIRELRGSIHVAGLATSGISPKEAHLLNNPGDCPNRPPAGTEYAGLFGWAEPWPDVSPLKAVRDEVEESTQKRMAQLIGAALTADEAEEFATLNNAIYAKIVG